MAPAVKPRPYRSAQRAAGAEATRLRIIAAARILLQENGYARTPVSEVARRARVSVDTIYASIGRKPQLALAVVDDILGEGAGPVVSSARDYVRAMEAARGLRVKLEVYARALGRLQPEMAPVLHALESAGEQDVACADAVHQIEERRAANMLHLAAGLRATGELRDDLDDRAVADLVWATNSWQYYRLLECRGFTPERYASHLADLWYRTLRKGGDDAYPLLSD